MRWTILKAAKGLRWFTSDHPVIIIHHSVGQTRLWASTAPGRTNDLDMPLDPVHLLYTQGGAEYIGR